MKLLSSLVHVFQGTFLESTHVFQGTFLEFAHVFQGTFRCKDITNSTFRFSFCVEIRNLSQHFNAPPSPTKTHEQYARKPISAHYIVATPLRNVHPYTLIHSRTNELQAHHTAHAFHALRSPHQFFLRRDGRNKRWRISPH